MNVYKICTDLGLFSRRPRLISRPWPWLDSSTPHGELILTVMGGAGSTSSSASSSGNVAMRASSEPWHVVRYSHASRCWMLASEEGSLSVTLRGKQWRPWLVTMTVVRPQSGAPCTERVLDVSGLEARSLRIKPAIFTASTVVLGNIRGNKRASLGAQGAASV